MKQTILALLVIGGLGLTANAQRIHNRELNQRERIQQGVRSGELTRSETRRLVSRERELRQDVRGDRIDGGGLTARERARIENRQDRLSRDIYRQKHDNQSRP